MNLKDIYIIDDTLESSRLTIESALVSRRS